MYFDRNIDLPEKIGMAKKSEGNYLSTALNEETCFRGQDRNSYKNFAGFLVDLKTPKDILELTDLYTISALDFRSIFFIGKTRT
jgi:hypothetical protein